jgi:hypothetical protein
VGPVILALGVGAALALVLAEVTTLYEVDVSSASCSDLADPDKVDGCHVLGGENHAFALLAVAVLTAVMAVGAGLGGSRPAGFALIGAAILVLAIALAIDLPNTDETGEIGENFEAAHAVKGPALWLELAGGALAAVAGALRLADRRGQTL